MIDRQPGLVLPLMNHFVEQRVERLVPSVPADVSPADRDLRGVAARGAGVVPQPTPHSSRHANGNAAKRATKVLRVVVRMPSRQLGHERSVFFPRSWPSRRRRGTRYGVGDDRPLRGMPLDPRAPFDEDDDRAQDDHRRVEVPFVHAQLSPAEAHHDVTVPCHPTSLDPTKTERAQASQEQLCWGLGSGKYRRRRCDNPRSPRTRRGRRRRQNGQVQLRWIEVAAPEQPLQRAKHLAGPGTKLFVSSAHTSVDTSMLSLVMRMLFTEPGRPPRARLEIVPAVEMTVPFFVCSI